MIEDCRAVIPGEFKPWSILSRGSVWLSAAKDGLDNFLCQEHLVHAASNSLLSRFTIVPIVNALAESDSSFACFWDAVEV
jgi:hypothetical protein